MGNKGSRRGIWDSGFGLGVQDKGLSDRGYVMRFRVQD